MVNERVCSAATWLFFFRSRLLLVSFFLIACVQLSLIYNLFLSKIISTERESLFESILPVCQELITVLRKQEYQYVCGISPAGSVRMTLIARKRMCFKVKWEYMVQYRIIDIRESVSYCKETVGCIRGRRH